jgi:peptidoglycan glycosyltransferase
VTPSIIRLFGLVVALFTLLVVFTTRWTVIEAESLRDHPANRRALLEEQRIDRGAIRAANREALARSVPSGNDTFRRQYPQDGLFAHAIGYSFINLGRSGLERYRNGALIGERDEVTSVVEQLRGKRREGDDVLTALHPEAQRVALNGLGGRRGAVVALEPRSGRVRVMVSAPGFNPNEVPRRFSRLNREEGSPLFNRVTQAGYPPGSTFKVVTAIAAIDSGRYTPDSTVSGENGKQIGGVPLNNFGNQSYGSVTLTSALTNSVNTVWAEVAETLGRDTMGEYMTRLGFYAKPPLDYPADQRRASGEYRDGELLSPSSNLIDPGRMGIGQDRLAVTPLQMALVASAVANDGTLVAPHITDEIVDPDGRVVDDVVTRRTRVMKKTTADAVAGMMSQVVNEGSGTAAALEGIEVAGKTGTAEIDPSRDLNTLWFIAFAPVDRPKVAIAVTVEREVGGTGGEVAAPIAKQVLESLLGEEARRGRDGEDGGGGDGNDSR